MKKEQYHFKASAKYLLKIHLFGEKRHFGVMDTLFVLLEMLIWKRLRSILKHRANSSQPLKTVEFS